MDHLELEPDDASPSTKDSPPIPLLHGTSPEIPATIASLPTAPHTLDDVALDQNEEAVLVKLSASLARHNQTEICEAAQHSPGEPRSAGTDRPSPKDTIPSQMLAASVLNRDEAGFQNSKDCSAGTLSEEGVALSAAGFGKNIVSNTNEAMSHLEAFHKAISVSTEQGKQGEARHLYILTEIENLHRQLGSKRRECAAYDDVLADLAKKFTDVDNMIESQTEFHRQVMEIATGNPDMDAIQKTRAQPLLPDQVLFVKRDALLHQRQRSERSLAGAEAERDRLEQRLESAQEEAKVLRLELETSRATLGNIQSQIESICHKSRDWAV